jgi:hypothetical protein
MAKQNTIKELMELSRIEISENKRKAILNVNRETKDIEPFSNKALLKFMGAISNLINT